MKVSFLVPVHDDVEGLRITLKSLAALEVGVHEMETIVCSDGGPRKVPDLATKFGCRIVELPENRGSYAACNLGLQVAHGEVLAFVDADERVAPRWLLAGIKAPGPFGRDSNSNRFRKGTDIGQVNCSNSTHCRKPMPQLIERSS